ncbi:MAG: DUF262 domain-containing protein [Roseburia sp.]|nr:DUF262 domain-containing protein [Roseburia sp.]
MSKINDNSITIYEALDNIKNGKYVMPAFQRQYCWNMYQIEKLWDSILLDYPIATFLFWHIDDENTTYDTRICNFLVDVTFNSRKQADSVNYDSSNVNVSISNTAILDGQQRLTSLFLSLYGSIHIRPKHARKTIHGGIVSKLLIELNKNKIEMEDEFNNKKFDIKFSEKVERLSPTQFEVRNILNPEFQEDREAAIEKVIYNVPVDSKDYARNILKKLYEKIFVEKLIRYTEINQMYQDDALEMFVRFNSGGKQLKKTEITTSILSIYWAEARDEFGKILVGSYKDFGFDFLIRSALMLYGDVIKTTITNSVANELKSNWNDFKKALKNLETVLKSFNIEVSHFTNSWNVLLPILYAIYWNPTYETCLPAMKAYLLRAILFNYFQSGTTGKLNQMRNNIKNYNYEFTIEMLNSISDLNVTNGRIEDILNSEKGSRIAKETLYYLSSEWMNKNFNYEEDHLHPYVRFDLNKPFTVSYEDWKQWRLMRNRLPNLHLLEGRSNGSKNDMSLFDYYNEMNQEQKEDFYKKSYIPKSVSLEFDSFNEFYEKRKELLEKKIRSLLG